MDADNSVSHKSKSNQYSKNQEDIEVVSLEEVIQKGGITGDKTDYLKGMLKSYFKKNVFHSYGSGLLGLAFYIFSQKILYKPEKNGYKLIKISTILSEISAISTTAKAEIDEDIKLKKIEKRRRM
ncbi:DUF4119 family protein [Bacteroides fragilis]|uniref:DUF4119 family protein n=1 Tax=Bacteroides fragilis TaxID=817 RepID=UPI00339D9AB8